LKHSKLLTMSVEIETIKESFEMLGDNHVGSSVDTPMREDAFIKSDEEKIEVIQEHFHKIMLELGLDLTDDSLKGTPYRVAKMFVKEIFSGLNPAHRPKISVFDNKFNYNKMLIESNISFNSTCEHHFLPIVGKAHVAYISSGKVIGLSKLNRIVDYFARRPQVQERMTRQIFKELTEVLETENVMVVISAEHLCVSSRGIQDKTSLTTTVEYGGLFEQAEFRADFYKLLEK
jgi:GTP cyclohydrolase IA